jgi:uncharacterized membrane protein
MKIRTERAETFSDSVIAIVITIMALQLLPDFSRDVDKTVVIETLRAMLPKLVAYALSFLMIGILWMNHHHMFHLLEKTDEPLLILNLMFLFWLSFIPMATSFFGANPFLSHTVALYGGVMLLTTLSFTIMRVHATKRSLLHSVKDGSLNQKISKLTLKAKTKSMLGTLSYILSIPFAFVNVYISFAFFLIPPIIFFIPDGIDDEQLAEKIANK